ncbi:MAG: uracil-DNA glycosylase [Candidatus Melainabacteria bacterium]|nr:uracil-DNA glycosylase [Candidatus Melainabacteria bacterium]MBI3308802.1 uracil-DNA glycosylase [Candidatus Melainabacteria bacterium]
MENQLNLFSLDDGQETRDHGQQTTDSKQARPDKGPAETNSILNPSVSILYNSLEEAKSAAMSCKKCKLCEGRTNVVFSDGIENAKIMIIGEGPGENEDLQGLPFVGRAGKLLDKIFESVGLNRKEHLYICNIVKCRPPNNRAPEEDEANACSEYLKAQIKYVNPKIIILAGAVAVKGILKKKDVKITKIRGEWIELEDLLLAGRKIMPIFHPSYLLRHEWNKAPDSPKAMMWKDIQEIKRVYDSLA